MGQRRKNNKHLPRRVYVHHGSYRYEPKDGARVTLARVGDIAGMFRALAIAQGGQSDTRLNTMSDLFNRYQAEILPKKAESTRKDQARQLQRLHKVFGAMDPRDLRAPHVARYRDLRARTAPTSANRELDLLSHVCTMAVEWGAIDAHPFERLRKIQRPPRQRYVTDEEYAFVRSLASPMIQCVMDLALLTGLRRGDVLRLQRKHITDAGIEIRTGKTGAALLFESTPALKKVVDDALALPPQVRQFVVCNRKGKAYTKNGFDSVWQRLMKKATDPAREQHVKRFEFRDLRRKSASDEADELVASQRLGHTSVGITNRVYRVKAKKVRPLR